MAMPYKDKEKQKEWLHNRWLKQRDNPEYKDYYAKKAKKWQKNNREKLRANWHRWAEKPGSLLQRGAERKLQYQIFKGNIKRLPS